MGRRHFLLVPIFNCHSAYSMQPLRLRVQFPATIECAALINVWCTSTVAHLLAKVVF